MPKNRRHTPDARGLSVAWEDVFPEPLESDADLHELVTGEPTTTEDVKALAGYLTYAEWDAMPYRERVRFAAEQREADLRLATTIREERKL